MDDYMVQAPNIFLEWASKTAKSQPSLNDPKLTEVERSRIMMRSFDNTLKTFRDRLDGVRSAKARHHNTLLPVSRQNLRIRPCSEEWAHEAERLQFVCSMQRFVWWTE
ncbi:hypothetical protein FRB94_003330 [Tulasnella sp. JGI-2019a]|nr:hypothetical protein FRB94_003330 [Tulasnella sp. JGI-2019a]KAG9005641.1 hypothetical protein FRB93_009567 [Tulasnella sp. JGI-2019a]